MKSSVLNPTWVQCSNFDMSPTCHITNAQCAVCTVLWSCSILAVAKKNTFSWKTKTIFEVIFPMFFEDENVKTCFTFHFSALETLCLENSKSVKINRKLQIWCLKVTVSSKIMFSFQPKKLGQIYVYRLSGHEF